MSDLTDEEWDEIAQRARDAFALYYNKHAADVFNRGFEEWEIRHDIQRATGEGMPERV